MEICCIGVVLVGAICMSLVAMTMSSFKAEDLEQTAPPDNKKERLSSDEKTG